MNIRKEVGHDAKSRLSGNLGGRVKCPDGRLNDDMRSPSCEGGACVCDVMHGRPSVHWGRYLVEYEK